MAATRENHLTFWRTVAADLKRGKPLVSAFEHAKTRVAGTEIEAAATAVIQEIQSGASLPDAMRKHEAVFSRSVRTMVLAAMAGGVLDVIAERIVEGIQDGSFPLPGAAAAGGEAPRWWRAFGRLISSGVPIIEALDILRVEVAGPALQEATGAIRQAILGGKDIASTLRTMPALFPEEVCVAVELGERRGDLDLEALRVADALEAGDLASLVADAAATGAPDVAVGERSAVAEFVNRMIQDAVLLRGSDIHFDPTEDGAGRIRVRVDGVLRDVEKPPAGLFPNVVSRIKLLSSMDLAERRLPQDGRIMLTLVGRALDLRVCVVPTVLGERIVIRILDRDAVRLDLEQMGFLEDELATARGLCHLPNGMIICNGPTGSGKTTLLYAMLMEVDREKCCVMSVEDPVEYRLDGIGQVQVEARKGVTFARALRSILRQDPDVIMVGEIRDLETLEVTAQCSLTGHLIMTTLHANTSPGAVKRLLDIGLAPFIVNSTLAAVITQRLVRVLCPKCKEEAKPALHSVPPAAAEFIQKLGDRPFYAPIREKGCDACKGTGFRGRIAIHEILIPDDRVRQAVAAGSDVAAIRNAALAAGMRPMLQCGLEKAARGITTVQEVCRVVPYGPNE